MRVLIHQFSPICIIGINGLCHLLDHCCCYYCIFTRINLLAAHQTRKPDRKYARSRVGNSLFGFSCESLVSWHKRAKRAKRAKERIPNPDSVHLYYIKGLKRLVFTKAIRHWMGPFLIFQFKSNLVAFFTVRRLSFDNNVDLYSVQSLWIAW